MPKRRRMKINGATLTDDPINDQTIVTVVGGGGGSGTVEVENNGSNVGSADTINFAGNGQNTTFSLGKATVQINRAVVQSEGALVGSLSVLNFVGSGVSVSDISGTMTVDIPGGGGGDIPRKIGGLSSELNLPGDTTFQQYLELPGSSSISFTAPDYGIWMIFASIELAVPSAAGGTRIWAVVNTSPTNPAPTLAFRTNQNAQSCPGTDMPDPFDWADQGDIKAASAATVISVSSPLTLNWYVGQSQNNNPTEAIIARNALLYAIRLGDL